MNEIEKKNDVLERSSTSPIKRQINPICVLSFGLGLIGIVLGSMGNPSYLLIGITVLISMIGLILAFVGRIRTKATNTKGNGLALTGLILNQTILVGCVIGFLHNMLGRPEKFGINEKTDTAMLIMVGVSFVMIAVCTAISIAYGTVAKRNR